MQFRSELRVAADAVREAALLCRYLRAEKLTGAVEKSDRSPVTIADFASQAVVCRQLKQAFPEDPVIAEEDADALRSDAELMTRVLDAVRVAVPDAGPDDVRTWIDHGAGRGAAARLWTLDPIDGTRGFLRGDQYAVALALLVDGVPVAAAIGCPNLDTKEGTQGTLMTAVRGGGTWQEPLDGGPATRVSVSGVRQVHKARVCESVESLHSAHGTTRRVVEVLGIEAAARRLDSQAKYVVVARGEAEIYLRIRPRTGYVEKIWDHAPGALAVLEAGGRVTDADGIALDFSHGMRMHTNRGVLVTNGLLHEQVVDAVRAER